MYLLGENDMAVDIIQFLIDNESQILLVLTVLFAMLARYFQNQTKILYDAGQAITDLQQAFLDDIKDGVLTKEEVDILIQKIEAAKSAIQAVIQIFTQPVTVAQRLDILLGAATTREKISNLKMKAQSMQMKRQ
jgi:hypothetical protein